MGYVGNGNQIIQIDNSEIKTQLVENLSFQNQTDFVETLKKLSSLKKNMTLEVVYGTQRQFRVHAKHSETHASTRTFLKDANDDFIIDYGTYYGAVTKLDAQTSAFNYLSSTGVFTTASAPHYWTAEIGATISGAFTGKRIDFTSWEENRGGIWEFVLDEGKPSEQRKTISVWAATAIVKQKTLFDNLQETTHTIKGIFKGADPLNPPSVAPARGWVYFGNTRPQDTLRTFYEFNESFTVNKLHDVEYSASNKELAIEIKPEGSGALHQFVPEHNATGTAFKVMEPILMADGKVVEWLSNSFVRNVEVIQLIQKVRGYHTSDMVNALLEITQYHTIKEGVCVHDTKIEFLRNTDVKYGYGVMIPYWTTFGKKIVSSTDKIYTVKTDNSKEYWSESNTKSFVIVNDVDSDERKDLAFAVTIEYFSKSMRKGELGIGNPFTWIEHNPTRGKLYFASMQNAIIPAGYIWRIRSKRLTTYLPEVSNTIK
ncbi:hypothetical protein ACFFJY_09385 [Fictibacillus aquaticus]|uniref:Uncharacterized protein n=1 Tax=Fictibacillus aquaticus TaxID=2021314 RepID=A0A235FAW8_9BACL|nr:hypothetical protein [Fictibacillus aquaticus]OYD58486.1 hypothetical protein CGZ90_00875 [Fictibacillus aquaticus]